MATVRDPVCGMEIDPATAWRVRSMRQRPTTSVRRVAATASLRGPSSTRPDDRSNGPGGDYSCPRTSQNVIGALWSLAARASPEVARR